jgi:hypothetical protein
MKLQMQQQLAAPPNFFAQAVDSLKADSYNPGVD